MDVFVLTSRMEGLPNVLIEAQCAGVPVVTVIVGGAAETFIEGKTGFGIGNATPEALTEALLRLTLDPKRRRDMSDAASTFAREEFSVGRMMARTLQLYKSESSSSQGARPVSTTTTS
jgi:glycosyltransferase involved in cell wall biosynthesis